VPEDPDEPEPEAREPEPEPVARDETTPRITAPPSPARVLIPALIAGLAAAVGFILSPGSHRAPTPAIALTQTASAGHFAISYPSGWRLAGPADPPPASLRLSAPVALVPRQGGGELFVGTTTAIDATLLPKGLAATLPAPAQGAAIKLGSLVFRRYLNLLPQGAAAPETVYALPTTAGAVIASCAAPAVNATVFASTCERAVASLRLISATPLTLTANPAFAKALGAAVARLDAARATDGSRLAGARRPADQAAAAHRLSLAHDDAATAAARLSPGPVGADANAAIVAALRRLGSAYASLAQAAAHHDGRAYAAASTAISRADAALGSAFARLAQDGYSIE
jgi:hypothetical protein